MEDIFSALSSAELFLLNNDLLVSTAGLTDLLVLELFTLKAKFFFTLFAIADSSFSVLFFAPMQVSSRQAVIL